MTLTKKGAFLRQYAKDAGVGGDLAISEEETADNTALVPGLVMHESGLGDVLYIHPSIFHKKVD